MRRKPIKHHIDALAALLLFGVFAACVLAVLLTGARAYHRLTLRDQAAYDRRTCAQYLATRVRQADHAGGIDVEEFGGGSLVLNADSDYPTWLYCQDGWLMELYCFAEERLEPEDGIQLMELQDLEASLEDGLLTLRIVTAGGGEETLTLALHSGEGETP